MWGSRMHYVVRQSYSSFSATKALQDAELDYSSVEQAVVGYCYGEKYLDSTVHS